MAVAQVTIRWTGFAGAPGTTTLNFGPGSPDPVDGAAMVDAADEFAVDIAAVLSNFTTIQVDPNVEWFDEDSGDLLDVTSVDPIPAPHTGNSGNQGPLPSGAVLSWNTAGINRFKKVRGRTYVVPLAATAYESNGTLTTAVQTALASAGTALMGAAGATFGIWSRPAQLVPGTGPRVGGAWFPATSVRVPDMAAVLRSRRD